MCPSETKTEWSQPNESSVTGVRSDIRWRLIKRILSTAPFQQSPRLHSLLSYLAEFSIRGKSDALTERQIGIAVFGKLRDYSTAEDSTVRAYVRQLRLALHEYFAMEGRQETQRVEIPEGSFVLKFDYVEPRKKPLPIFEWLQNRWLIQIFSLAALATAVVCAIGWHRAILVSSHQTPPWPLNRVLQADLPTRIVVSDSGLMLRRLGDHRITLEEYLQQDYPQRLIPANVPRKVQNLLNYIADAQLTSFADVSAVSSLMKVAGPFGRQLVLTPAHDIHRDDMKQGNYIFVGGPTSNPWVALFIDKLNFQPVEETVGGGMHFHNRHPLPGERMDYQGLASTGSTGQDYATISVLPGQAGHGNVLILQGLRQAGTEALGAALANNEDRAALEQAVERQSNSAAPYFEVLVRSTALAGAPVSFTIVAVRIIQPE
jgi:hypothetical protein